MSDSRCRERLSGYAPVALPGVLRPAFALSLAAHALVLSAIWQLPPTAAAISPAPVIEMIMVPRPSQVRAAPSTRVPARTASVPMHAATAVVPVRHKVNHRRHVAASLPEAGVVPVTVPPAVTAVMPSHGRDTAPTYRDQPRPRYPVVARRRGLEGVVVLWVDVDADGAPLNVEVCSGSGHAVLDAAALTAVRAWHFTPARRAGRAVRVAVQVPIRFQLAPAGPRDY